MRKRIIIGLLAVVVIGVVAFIFSQPKRESVEWHKRKYAEALREKGDFERIRWVWSKIAGPPVHSKVRQMRFAETLQSHEQALLRLGALEERRFPVMSDRAAHLAGKVLQSWNASNAGVTIKTLAGPAGGIFVTTGGAVTNFARMTVASVSLPQPAQFIAIITVPEQMDAWADSIQRVDGARDELEPIRNIGLLLSPQD